MSDTKRTGGQFVFLVTDGPKELNVRMYGTRSRQNIALYVMPGLYYPAVGSETARVESLLPRPLRLEMELRAVEILAEMPERTLCRFTLGVQRSVSFGILLPEDAPYDARMTKFKYDMELYAMYSYYHNPEAGAKDEDEDKDYHVNAGELATSLDKFHLPSPIDDLLRTRDNEGREYYKLGCHALL